MNTRIASKLGAMASRGFTLLEVCVVTAIIGVLASLAFPIYVDYSMQARTSEGLQMLSELRRRVEIGFNETNGIMPIEIPDSPEPTGQFLGGPFYSYSSIFGVEHNMWERVEFQPKGPHRVLVLKSHRREAWLNADLSLHLQVKYVNSETLDFRCSVSATQETGEFLNYIPASCRNTNSNDWTSW